MNQLISSAISIKDPAIINHIYNRGITSVSCSVVNDENGKYFVIKSSNEKRAIKLVSYKKMMYKIRTPACMIPFSGKTIKVIKSIFAEDPEEVFRIEPIDFSIASSKLPYFTSRNFVVPNDYANLNLDERAEVSRVSFNETTISMIEEGNLYVYFTEDKTPMSYPLHKSGKTLRSSDLTQVMSIMDGCNKKLENFEYSSTMPKDQFHKYGTMIFKEAING